MTLTRPCLRCLAPRRSLLSLIPASRRHNSSSSDRPGPLPSDPLAPPPPTPRAPRDKVEPGKRSIIFDPNYPDKRRWVRAEGYDAEETRLNPYAYMLDSYIRRCSRTNKQFPKLPGMMATVMPFMLKLRGAVVDDKAGQVALFPEGLQHERYVPSKKGKSAYCMLHRETLEALAFRGGSGIFGVNNIMPGAQVPRNLPEMVEDGLGKRVVQELDQARRVMLTIPKKYSAATFFRPLSAEQEKAVLNDQLPAYDDASVIGVLDLDLRHPVTPKLFANGDKDPDTPVFPLGLASHAPRAVALLRNLLSLEVQRKTESAVSAAGASVAAEVEERAREEGVSKYEAGTEEVSERGNRLPQPEIDAATDGVETYRAVEGARFVAVTVPRDLPVQWRAVGVPLVIALIRVGLFHGIGWVEPVTDGGEVA